MNPIPTPALRLQQTGIAMAVVALASPFITAVLGGISAAAVSFHFMRALVLLVSFGAIAWVVTRKQSVIVKANAQMAVGLAVCLFMGDGLLRSAQEERQADAYVRNAIKFQGVQSARYAALNAQFDQIHLDAAMSPEALSSADGRKKTQATIARYRNLVTQRDNLIAMQAEGAERMADALPTESQRRAAMDGTSESLAPARRLYTELGEAQNAMADAMDTIVTWCETKTVTCDVKSATLALSNSSDDTAMQSLFTRLNDARVRVYKAAVELAAFHAQMGSKALAIKRATQPTTHP